MILFWAALIATGLAGLGLIAYAHDRRRRAYRDRLYRYSREHVRQLRRENIHLSNRCIGQRQYIAGLQRHRDELLDELATERKLVSYWKSYQRRVWPELWDVRDRIEEN